MKKLGVSCVILSAIMLIVLPWLIAAYPGPVGQVGADNWTQTSPLQVSGTLALSTTGSNNLVLTGGTVTVTAPIPGYAIQGSGAFQLSGTNTTAFYVSSGTTTATSVPCNSVTLALAGTGMLTSGGTSGMGFATSATNAWSSPLTISATNLNTLAVTGSGQASYVYSQ